MLEIRPLFAVSDARPGRPEGRPLLLAVLLENRKKKAIHKTTSTDDKRLQNTLKRLGVNTIPGIEEVNIFKDESVIHFTNPKGEFTHCRSPHVASAPGLRW